jgi:hypothetical protein
MSHVSSSPETDEWRSEEEKCKKADETKECYNKSKIRKYEGKTRRKSSAPRFLFVREKGTFPSPVHKIHDGVVH